jgi:hypothetical protein
MCALSLSPFIVLDVIRQRVSLQKSSASKCRWFEWVCVSMARAGWWATLLADCLRLNKRYRKSSHAGICLQTSYLLSITNHPSIFSLDHNTHTNASLDSFLLLFLRRASSFHVSSSRAAPHSLQFSPLVFAACAAERR